MNWKRLSVLASVAVIAGLLIVLAIPSAAQETGTTTNTITVTGSGLAYGDPDVAYVEVGVDIVNADFATAYNEASGNVQKVINALKEVGLDEKDIQTTGINVWLEDRYDPQSGTPTGERVYHVTVSMRITVRDVSKIEEALTTAVNNGANSVYGLNFGISDTDALKRDARADAVEDARARAQHLAELNGVTLGDPVTISEYSDSGYIPPMYGGRGGGGFDATAQSIPVQPGQLSVSTSVTITFSISK